MSSPGEHEVADKSLWVVAGRTLLVFVPLLLILGALFLVVFEPHAIADDWPGYLWSIGVVVVLFFIFVAAIIYVDRRFWRQQQLEPPEVFGAFFSERSADKPITREEVCGEICGILKDHLCRDAFEALTPETALFHDLELCGDDVDEFFHDLSSKFDLWEPLFDSREYFPAEEDVAWSWRIKKEKYGIMTVADLSDVVFLALREKHRDSEWAFETAAVGSDG